MPQKFKSIRKLMDDYHDEVHRYPGVGGVREELVEHLSRMSDSIHRHYCSSLVRYMTSHALTKCQELDQDTTMTEEQKEVFRQLMVDGITEMTVSLTDCLMDSSISLKISEEVLAVIDAQRDGFIKFVERENSKE